MKEEKLIKFEFLHYLILLIGVLVISCGRPNHQTKDANETQEQSENAVPEPTSIDTVHVYLENSASMWGYLNGRDFKIALSRLLNNLELITPNLRSDNFKFNYINDQIHPTNHDLESFLHSLNDNGVNVGNITTSDLNLIFETVLGQTQPDHLGIMVTDAIFDLNGDPNQVFQELEISTDRTRNIFIQKLQGKPLETVVIKLNSDFDGRYFSYNHNVHNINQKRPYYIWLFFGESSIIRQARDTINFEQIPGFVDKAHFFVLNDECIPYTVLLSERIGTYKISKSSAGGHILDDCSKGGRGFGCSRPDSDFFGFSMAVDFSTLPLDDRYLKNLEHYDLSNGYEIVSIERIGEYKPSPQDVYQLNKMGISPTHVIKLKTQNLVSCDLAIQLKREPFEWIQRTGVDNDDPPDTSSTFAFNRLMRSVVEAYDNMNGHSNYAQFKIKINKN